MFRSFDIYGQYERPQFVLANPNGEEIAVISNYNNAKMKLNFCAYSELSFNVPSVVNNGEEIPCYKLLQQTRLVKVEGFGVFTISSVSEQQDGISKYKEITCKTIDSLFAVTSIVALDDTIRLYDPKGIDKTVCSMFLADFPDWNIGYVDEDLYYVYRTYDITEDNWYNFLYNSIRDDFECIVKVDTNTKTISFYSLENGIIGTDIFFSFENVVKKLNIETVEDGIQTALEVYGGNDLSIHDVNPLGTGVIYNFSYYKNTDWIKQDTVDAITKWENLVKSKTTTYQNLITQLRALNKQLVTLKANLTDIQTEYDSVENVLSARAEMKYDTTEQAKQLETIRVRLNAKKTEITNCEQSIKNVQSSLIDINTSLSFEKNFTQAQLLDLHSILRKGTYSNSAYAITDSMTTEEILETESDLMATAQNTLNQVCMPRYTIDTEIINILALQEFKEFANQLELGCYVTMEIDKNTFAKLVLMQYEINFDNMTNVKVVFSNSTNLNDGMISFAELFNGMQSTISNLSTSSGIYKKFVKSGADETVQSWVNESLDLAQKAILSSTGQSVDINQAGLWLRKQLEDGSYAPKQFLMTNNSILMTDSNWQGIPKLAIGEFTLDGITHFGCCKDKIICEMIKGEI